MDSEKLFLLLGYEHSTKRLERSYGYGYSTADIFTRNIIASQDVVIFFDPLSKTISITPGDYELSCREMDAIQLYREEEGWTCKDQEAPTNSEQEEE